MTPSEQSAYERGRADALKDVVAVTARFLELARAQHQKGTDNDL
jgi:hypothetical protein